MWKWWWFWEQSLPFCRKIPKLESRQEFKSRSFCRKWKFDEEPTGCISIPHSLLNHHSAVWWWCDYRFWLRAPTQVRATQTCWTIPTLKTHPFTFNSRFNYHLFSQMHILNEDSVLISLWKSLVINKLFPCPQRLELPRSYGPPGCHRLTAKDSLHLRPRMCGRNRTSRRRGWKLQGKSLHYHVKLL